MRNEQTVSTFDLRAGLITEHDDGKFRTLIYGFVPGCEVHLTAGYTHLGCVFDGELTLRYQDRERRLYAGDHFSVVGPATVSGSGWGMSSAQEGYVGINAVGGPIEPTGRLRYIDGCTDSLLVPPVRKGDPCLNHLHFPRAIVQTPHTHPSVRTGLVYRGSGVCVVPNRPPIPLRPGSAFVIPTDVMHSFNTAEDTMDVIAFHPDSDTGMTDDDHPMVNRTMVGGVSASRIAAIRTTVPEEGRARQAPLSYSQERIWFLGELETATTEHNMPKAFRVRGPLDLAALRRAINGIVVRHEILRTRIDDSSGQPLQIIDPHLEIDLPLLDLTGLDAHAREQRVAAEIRSAWEVPFDLHRGPLLRAKVLKLADDEHILVRASHLIISDGWSEEVLFPRELAELYSACVEGRAPVLPRLELQYADHALWQRRTFEAGSSDPGLQYWRSQLGDSSEPLRIPSRRPRRNHWDAGAEYSTFIDGPILDDIRQLARQAGVTVATVWLAAFQVLLARWAGERRVPVGVVVANRERNPLKDLLGHFVNFVVIRADLSDRPTFREFLRQVADRCYEGYSHQDVPFVKLVEGLNPARNLAWNPLFQVIFNMLNYPRAGVGFGGLEVEELPIARDVRSSFDLKFTVRAEQNAAELIATYNAHMFDAADITALLDEFRAVLHDVIRHPDAALRLESGGAHLLSPAALTDVAARGADEVTEISLTDEQRTLCELFAEVLELEDVAPDDDFFALGGHSLLVMTLRNRVRARLRVDLPLRAVFEAPTVRKLSMRLHS